MKTDTQTARDRVAQAFSPDLFSQLTEQWCETLTSHMREALHGQTKVLNWAKPEENIEAAEKFLVQATAPDTAEETIDRFRSLLETSLAKGHNLHHPGYIGHQVPAPVPLAGLFDAMGAITNQVMAIYEMGPWITAIETALIHEVGQQLGFKPHQFSGLVTHGGSLANLTALLTARNVMLENSWEKGLTNLSSPPVLITHADAHYSVARTAGILGLGTEQILKAELDEQRHLDPHKLDLLLTELKQTNRPVIAVCACCCATPIGAFDSISEIADVCEKHQVWLHVDAAHGGAACFSERHAHLLAGIERADSIVCDAHKMMFVPALCAFVFYKNREHRFEAFRQSAPYLFDPSAPGMAEFDSGMKTIECTKRAAAIGLWGTWSLFGKQLFADMVDVTFELGQTLYEKLTEADDFVPLHRPECNILAFRHLPDKLAGATPEQIGAFQREIRRQLIQSGQFYIVQTQYQGVGALRVSIMNPMTQPEDFDTLLQTLRELGEQIEVG